MKNEIFGPILPIFEFEDLDPVIDRIKNGESGLTMYYYGDIDTNNYLRLLNET